MMTQYLDFLHAPNTISDTILVRKGCWRAQHEEALYILFHCLLRS